MITFKKENREGENCVEEREDGGWERNEGEEGWTHLTITFKKENGGKLGWREDSGSENNERKVGREAGYRNRTGVVMRKDSLRI